MVAASQIVYVGVVPHQMTASAVANYLQEAYGLELKVKLRKHASSAKPKGSKYAFLTFTSQEEAESAISQSNYSWPNGNRIIMRQYTGQRAPQHIEKPALAKRSILETLAPENLINIYKHMSPLDVANASETSDYLHDFAQSFICKKYAHLAFDSQREPNDFRQPFTWMEFERVIRHFGVHVHFFKWNTLSFYDASDDHLALVLEHCPNLSELCVVNFTVSNKSVEEIHKGQSCVIKNLRLINVAIEQSCQLFPFISGSLECLKLIRCLLNSTVLFNQLHKHSHALTHLAMIDYLQYSDRPYRDIGSMLPQLQSLQITVSTPQDLLDLAGLNVLKNLQLVVIQRSNVTTQYWPLSGLPQIEELYVSHINCINMVSFTELTSLRVLVIQNTINMFGLAETVNALPNLQRLCIANQMISLCDMLHMIEINTNRNLAVVEFYSKPIYVHQLIDALVERDYIHFQLRIVIDPINLEWVLRNFPRIHYLSYVHFVDLEDYLKEPKRFDDCFERINMNTDLYIGF